MKKNPEMERVVGILKDLNVSGEYPSGNHHEFLNIAFQNQWWGGIADCGVVVYCNSMIEIIVNTYVGTSNVSTIYNCKFEIGAFTEKHAEDILLKILESAIGQN